MANCIPMEKPHLMGERSLQSVKSYIISDDRQHPEQLWATGTDASLLPPPTSSQKRTQGGQIDNIS